MNIFIISYCGILYYMYQCRDQFTKVSAIITVSVMTTNFLLTFASVAVYIQFCLLTCCILLGFSRICFTRLNQVDAKIGSPNGSVPTLQTMEAFYVGHTQTLVMIQSFNRLVGPIFFSFIGTNTPLSAYLSTLILNKSYVTL